MKTKQQYESELKRLLDLKNTLEKSVKKIDEENYEKRQLEFKKYKKAEREYTKLLDEYVTNYSKI